MRIFRHYISGVSLAWLAGDILIVLVAYWAIESWMTSARDVAVTPGILLAGVTTLLFYIGELYGHRLPMGRREIIARILICQLGVAVFAAATGFVFPSLQLDRAGFFATMAVTPLALIAWRLAWLSPWATVRTGRSVLVVGTGRIGDAVAELEGTSARPFRLAGFVDDNPSKAPSGHRVLGGVAELPRIVDEIRPNLIVVAQLDRRGGFPAAELLEVRLRGVSVEDWPTFYERVTGRILVSDLRPSWLIFSDGFVKSRGAVILKRCVDIVLALVGMVLASPFIILTAVAVRLDSPGPVLYRQIRMGQYGVTFVIYKFRSMHPDAELATGPVWASKGDSRVTRVGRFLRRSRLDELPQLLNVLRGDMSFIGPRPERPEFIEELERRIPFYRARLSVKPGITGWAQVRYTYGASVEDSLVKLQYDLYYVKNLSPFLDLLILISTVQVVLFGRGQ